MKKAQLLIIILILAFGGFLYWLNTCYFEPYSFYSYGTLSYEKAVVLAVEENWLEEDTDTVSGYKGRQQLKVLIKSGSFKGETVTVDNHLTRTHNIYAEEGTELIVCLDKNSRGYHTSVYNYSRSKHVYLMVILFVLLMVTVGGMKGFKSAIGLFFSIICILYFTLPLIFHGCSPIPVAVVSVILITAVTLIMIDGMTGKALVALAGTAAGVIAAGLLFLLFSTLLKVSGFNLDEAEALYLISQNTGLQLRHVLFASVLIAALGAVMDVAMSVASTINELHERNPQLNSKELFDSGINVGKDMIGTMSNTLILAYTGSSLSTMILFMAYSINYHQIINMDYIVLEISQALAGSMGIILTVPCAAFLGARMACVKG